MNKENTRKVTKATAKLIGLQANRVSGCANDIFDITQALKEALKGENPRDYPHMFFWELGDATIATNDIARELIKLAQRLVHASNEMNAQASRLEE